MPFWRFVGFNLIGEAIWSAMIVSIGYFLGNIYITVNNALGKAFITVFVIILVVVIFGVANYLRKWVLAQTDE